MLRPPNKFLDYKLTTSDRVFRNFTDVLFSEIGIVGNLRDVKKEFLITLLMNLKLNYESNTFVNVPLRPEYYADIADKYRTPKHSYEVTKQIVEALAKHSYIILNKGDNDSRQTSSCKASLTLYKLLNSFPKTIITREKPQTFVVLREFDEELQDYIETDYDAPLADAINEEIKEYATVREKTSLSLKNIPKQIFELCRENLNALCLENTNKLIPDINGCYNVNLIPSYPVRIFSNDFNNGGRFYRGVETELRQRHRLKDNSIVKIKLRQYLHINNNHTIELDYNAMHPRMLYHRKRVNYRDDPYTIGRNCDENLRSIYKLVSMICINSENEFAAIDGIQKTLQDKGLVKYLPDNTDNTRRKLINAFKRHNKPIEEFFFTGVGIELQKVDSDIAHSILLHFARKGILVLCVHDSFIIEEKYESELKKKMREFYFQYLRFQPKIK
ncbi:MAG: hypothetical protein ACOYN6_01915 [Ignavibacteria bacterium]